MSRLGENAIEEAKHLKAIQRIAREIGRGVALVRKIYEQELQRLQVGARVRDYLPLLATRHTIEILQKTPKLESPRNKKT